MYVKFRNVLHKYATKSTENSCIYVKLLRKNPHNVRKIPLECKFIVHGKTELRTPCVITTYLKLAVMTGELLITGELRRLCK